jgi:hypothetical protein
MNKIEVTITSYPDRPDLIAEMWCENGLWGELRFHQPTGAFSLELFPLERGIRPLLDVGELERELAKAKRRLLEIQGLASPVQA